MPLYEMDVKQSASVHSLKDGSLADVVIMVLRVSNDTPDIESTRPIHQPPAAPTDTRCPDPLIVLSVLIALRELITKVFQLAAFSLFLSRCS